MANNRELQSVSYRIGRDQYEIDDFIQRFVAPENALAAVVYGIGIGVPAHEWFIRTDDTGVLGIHSGSWTGPAPFKIEPGASEGLLTLTSSDQFSWAGDINVGGNYFVGGVSLYDTISDLIKNVDWQDSVISDTTPIPGAPSEGDRYIAPATAGGWIVDYIYEYMRTDPYNPSSPLIWTEFIPNEGYATFVEDTDKQNIWNGAAWVLFGTTVAHNNLAGIQGGVGVTEQYHLRQSAYNNLLSQDQEVYTSSTPSFAGLTSTANIVTTAADVVVDGTVSANSLTVNGNITVTGTVDGRDVAVDGIKLDTLELGKVLVLTTAEIAGIVEAGKCFIVYNTDEGATERWYGTDDVRIID